MEELIGYHATGKEFLDSIKQNGFKKKTSAKSFPNDLGNGIYFYIDRPKYEGEAKNNAKNYAEKYKSNYKEIVVLEVDILKDSDKVLDFNDNETADALEKFIKCNEENIYKEFEKFEKFLGATKRGNLDGIAIELFIEYFNLPVDIVFKNTFTKFNNNYKISSFTNGKEACVRNENIIIMKDIRVIA